MSRWVDQIVGEPDFGDKRLNRRMGNLVEQMVERPEAPIPQACGSWAGTVGAYRFLDYPAVTPKAITDCLASGTVERCSGVPVVLAVQDTTSLDFTSHAKTTGLGPLERPEMQGIFLHTTLAVSETGVPLGILGQQMWVRDADQTGRRRQRKRVPVEGKESRKWLDGLCRTEALLKDHHRVVTVADREADIYELFALAKEIRGDWLIRARHDRRIDEGHDRLRAAVERAPVDLTFNIEVPRANRGPRTATVEVRRTEVTLVPPRRETHAQASWWTTHAEVDHLVDSRLAPLTVRVISVREPDPPAGESALHWLLVTSLSIATPESALQCVEWYCQRWKVEQFHYVLKSGCHAERLQLHRADKLERALALRSAIAWALLYVTFQARCDPTAPCTTLLDDDAWKALWTFCLPAAPLPDDPPSLQHALVLIARLGGFLARKHDGQPGVKTTWRGLTRLSDILATWRILTQRPTPALSAST